MGECNKSDVKHSLKPRGHVFLTCSIPALQDGNPSEDDLQGWGHHSSASTVPDIVMQRVAGEDVSFVFTCEISGKLPEGLPPLPVPRPGQLHQPRGVAMAAGPSSVRGTVMGQENRAPKELEEAIVVERGKQKPALSRVSAGDGLNLPLRANQPIDRDQQPVALLEVDDGELGAAKRTKVGLRQTNAAAPPPSEIEVMELLSDSDDY